MKKVMFLCLLTLGLAMVACQSSEPTEASVESPAVTTQLFLVRHAEKQLDAGKNPELTEEGKERAKSLAFLLRSAGITQVYSSDFARTRQTAQPLADSLGVKVQLYDHKNPAVVEQIASQHPGENVLVVGHSNTVPPMANHLLQERKYESLEETEYNKVFVVTTMDKGKGQAYLLQY